MQVTPGTKAYLDTIETLNQFRTVLRGQWLKIYTDYKNFTCKLFSMDRVLIWRLIIKEYGADI